MPWGKGLSLPTILFPQFFKQPGRLFHSDFISLFQIKFAGLVQLRIGFILTAGGRASRGRRRRSPAFIIRIRMGSPIRHLFVPGRIRRERSWASRGQLLVMAFAFPDSAPDLLVSDHSAVLTELLWGQKGVLFQSEISEVEPVRFHPV